AAFLAAGATCSRPGAAAPPARSKFLRFPFGACDPRSMAAVNEAGMAAIQWDVSTGDPSPFATADMIVAATLRSVRPGSIVLAHANGRGFATGAALPRILDELTRRGFRFVTVGELLAAGRPLVTATCWDARPGDTDHYGLFGRRLDPWPTPASRRPTAEPRTTPGPTPARPRRSI
ncbi:MAG: hypothetical protein OEL76_03750, partial [Siculibacillus sp.]|nr:hypothetical protein [Siculibacillus sp.]